MTENLNKKGNRNQPVDLDIDLDLAPEQNQNQDLVQTTLPVAEPEPEPAQALHVIPSTTTIKIPVAGATLRGRIKRVLQGRNSELRQYRGPRNCANESAGWYIVDLARNESTGPYKDLEVLGRELGALQPWERLASE
jgi:hypothetical protein